MLKVPITRALARRRMASIRTGTVAALLSIGLVPAVAMCAPNASAHAVADGGAVGEVQAARAVDAPVGKAASHGLPVIEHSRVDSWIKRFTTTQRGSMATYLRRMDRYDEMISDKLADRGMPQGLIYLAMIESGFDPGARSQVSATGLWQFMKPTAKEYGLTVSRGVDERTNPARATDAALEYLGDLHRRFGSWYLAAAAYNTGQGRVARVLNEVTGRKRGTDADYYRIAHRLPEETRDYVPKMIAAASIGSDPERYGFSPD